MRRAALLIFSICITPPLGVAAQNAPLQRTLIDSFVTSNVVTAAAPVYNRQRIYYLLRPDTLMLYDIATKRSQQIGVGRWGDLAISHTGDVMTFSRPTEGTRNTYVWAMPLNPATGMPTGPARRASMSQGYNAAISPDGKWLAFAADSDHKRLTVIPTSGGRERDLLRGPGDFWNIEWSNDGNQLYFTCTTPGKVSHDEVKRVALAGGAPVTIDDRDVALDALSLDQTHLVMEESSWPWNGPIAVDLSGHRIPATQLDSAYVSTKDLLTSTRALEHRSYQPNTLMNMPIGGGVAREIAPSSINVSKVAWSADGARYAVISRAGDSVGLLVEKSDGTDRHLFPLRQVGSASSLDWSPDGRAIAVLGSQHDTPRLLVVNPTTGQAQVAPVHGYDVESPRWERDSKRILYFSGELADSDDVHVVRETSAGGTDRLVLTLPRKVQGASMVLSDSSIIAVGDSGASFVSLPSGRSTPLYQYDGGRPGVSPRGDLIVIRPPQREATGGARHNAEVMTLTGQHVATVTFPGVIGFGVLDHFLWMPDQRSIIGTGRDAAGTCCTIYQGFLDGTPTRVIGQAPSGRAPAMSLSPDGKTLLYTVASSWITMFKSLDISGLTKGMAIH